MRFKEYQQPQDRDQRIRRVFLLVPTTLPMFWQSDGHVVMQTRWLEYAWVTEEYRVPPTDIHFVGGSYPRWHKIHWAKEGN